MNPLAIIIGLVMIAGGYFSPPILSNFLNGLIMGIGMIVLIYGLFAKFVTEP